jgi:hypothetical protein
MYLLYSDETNLDPTENIFFIYGGIIINGERAKNLSDNIQRQREDRNIPNDFILKFNPGPGSMSHEDFIELKQTIVQKAIENECVALISMIHHKIATSPEEARRKEINRIAYHFNCLLSRVRSHGIMLIDRFSDRQIDAHLREKFSTGITGMPYTRTLRLDRIIGYHYSAIGQSHFGSLVDIVIGSLRFAVNAFSKNEEHNLETASRLLRLLAPLFYGSEVRDNQISELSLFFSPKIIRAPAFRKHYEKIKAFLASNGIEAEQEITDQRMY